MLATLLAAVMLLAISPAYAGAAIPGVPASLKAPTSLTVTDPATDISPYATHLNFAIDAPLVEFLDTSHTDYDALGISSVWHTAQVDWQLNGGPWHYTPAWDSGSQDLPQSLGYPDTGYLISEVTQTVEILDLRNNPGEVTPLQQALGSALIRGADESGWENRLDLQNNTFRFRVRIKVAYFGGDADQETVLHSPWSETIVFGKDAAALKAPTSLEAPVISNPVIGKNEDGSPKISFTAVTPKQVQDANSYVLSKDGRDIDVEHQVNINNAGWIHADAGADWLGAETRDVHVPATYDNGKSVQIDSAFIQVRMRYVYTGGASVPALQSPWSNVISVNTPAWSNASAWATPELTKADELGLIPARLKGADMTKPITRAEFAALGVRLYEAMSGKTAEPASVNPFTDTSDAEILKAYNLGIVKGMSATTFEPNTLINREQAATMLTRTVSAAKPEIKIDTAGAPTFADAAKISDWARESVLFMAKNSIIKGMSENGGVFFRPRNTTSAEVATLYANATREQSIAIAVRSLENLR